MKQLTKLLLVGVLMFTGSVYAEDCLTSKEAAKAVTTDTIVKPTGKCTENKTTKLDEEKVFKNSTDTVSYKTNALVEGYTGYNVAVVTQGTAPLSIIPSITESAASIADKAKQSIQMDKQESTAYKAGITLGTIAIIGVSYFSAKRSAKKDMDETIKPLKEANAKLLEGNTKLQEKLDTLLEKPDNTILNIRTVIADTPKEAINAGTKDNAIRMSEQGLTKGESNE